MKKKILLFTLLDVTLLLTSCLGEGSLSYSESSVAYIAIDETSGQTYGRTLTGRYIINSEIELMQAGTFKYFTYSWDEAYGTTPIGEVEADNVVISGDLIDVSRTTLNMSADPTIKEDPRKFVDMDSPYYADNEFYLGDHWLFQYAYESQKGETAVVQFYLTDESNPDEDEFTIAIQLSFTGTPEEGASTTSKTDIIALNMAPLRSEYEGTSQTATKELKITFQYYLEDMTTPTETQTYGMTVDAD